MLQGLRYSRHFASYECCEQGFGFPEVGRVKALGEPTVSLRQQCLGVHTLALALPQACQAHGGAQVEGPGLLLQGDVEGLTKTVLGPGV